MLDLAGWRMVLRVRGARQNGTSIAGLRLLDNYLVPGPFCVTPIISDPQVCVIPITLRKGPIMTVFPER